MGARRRGVSRFDYTDKCFRTATTMARSSWTTILFLMMTALLLSDALQGQDQEASAPVTELEESWLSESVGGSGDDALKKILEGRLDDPEDKNVNLSNSVALNKLTGDGSLAKSKLSKDKRGQDHGHVTGAGYTANDAYLGETGHYYIGPSRRRIGAGFGRRRGNGPNAGDIVPEGDERDSPSIVYQPFNSTEAYGKETGKEMQELNDQKAQKRVAPDEEKETETTNNVQKELKEKEDSLEEKQSKSKEKATKDDEVVFELRIKKEAADEQAQKKIDEKNLKQEMKAKEVEAEIQGKLKEAHEKAVAEKERLQKHRTEQEEKREAAAKEAEQKLREKADKAEKADKENAKKEVAAKEAAAKKEVEAKKIG